MNNDMTEFMKAVNAVAGHVRDHGMESVTQPATDTASWARTLASASCWAQAGDSYFPVNSVVKTVPPGAYRCMLSNTGPYVERMQINIDHLLTLPDSSVEKLLAEFDTFWKLQPEFASRGFTFKRGMLMWGPPGSGKTSGIWQMTQRLVKDHGGIVIFVEQPQVAAMMLHIIRRIEPERPIVTVMEDIDSMIRHAGEHSLLALLDGEIQIDRVVHVATTNYPHMLDRRFIDRPSRFDTIMKIGMPSAEARRVYFTAKEPGLSSVTLDRWVERSEGYSVAHLREVCIATQCFKQNEDAVFERLDIMRRDDNYDNLDQDGDERQAVGFNAPIRKIRPYR